MVTPLQSRKYRVGAKAYGVAAPERDSPEVFAPMGSGYDGSTGFCEWRAVLSQS
jgi:hypothetical protein